MRSRSPRPTPLRVLCLEDNPLIVFHLEQMIEDLGHVFWRALDSFADLCEHPAIEADVSLVDIDLADGSTGPVAARWLRDRGIPSIFVTGQAGLAAPHASVVVATLIKPVSAEDLRHALDLVSKGKFSAAK